MPDERKRQQSLESLRENIETSDEISERDRDALLDFDDKLTLLKSKYSVHRHEKLLRHVWRVAKCSDASVADTLEDRAEAEEAVRWIHRNYDNEETNRDYRVALRQFGRHATDGDSIPESLNWISATTSSDYNPKPNPGDMISHDEMKELVDAAFNHRDAALAAVAWDAGCRSGEFRDLTVGDVSDHDHGLQITVDGKTGQRTVTLIPSVPYLRQWLNAHPGESSDAPLWCKLDEATELSFRSLQDALERLADRAGVDKPVNLTNFRKSRASDLASRGMSQVHLENRMGWVRGSDAAARYISVFAEAADREFARLEGIDVEDDEPDPTAPVSCPRCDKETPRDEEVCVWCGQALDPVAAEQLDKVEDDLFDSVAEAADEEDIDMDDLRRVKELLDKPEFRALMASGDS